MGVSNKEIAKDIENLELKLQELGAEKFGLQTADKYLDVFFEYNRLSAVSKTVENNKNLLETVEILKRGFNNYLDKEAKELIKKKDYKKLANIVILALQVDINNICYTEDLINELLDLDLYTEAIELYKTMFLYSPKPEYFEKMGDIYLREDKLEAAIDAYLNSVEISDNNCGVYRKLADLFEKAGDIASRDICLAQISNIKGENDK